MARAIESDPHGPSHPSTFINDTGFLNMQERKERDQRWRESMQPCIEAMVNGTRPVACPWENPLFQDMVLKALAKGGTYRRDAEKLAVIREVFGSKS